MAEAVNGMTSEEYRKYLVEAVKIAGKMIIDNAEDIVGNIDCVTDLGISCDFYQDLYDSIPKITVTKGRLPTYEMMDYLIKKRDEIVKEN